MQLLKFSKKIAEEDLLNHVMGPDMYGGYLYVQAVMWSPEDYPGKTVCVLYPLAPDETRLTWDEFGQQKVTF
jgi:hypothetical protein